jgi:hypothetical protein
MMYKNIVLSSASKKKIVQRHAAVELGLQLIQDKTGVMSLIPTIENRVSELKDMLETEYPTHYCQVFVTRKPTAVESVASLA